MPTRFQLLTEADVKRVLSMDDLIETMTAALKQFSKGEVVQPVRTIISVDGDRAFFGLMPAFVGGASRSADVGVAGPALVGTAALGTKLVTVFNANHDRGLRQFTVGSGGAFLYNFVTVAANSEARIRSFGVLKLTLESSSYEWQFIQTNGAIADSGVGQCH